MKYMRAQQWLRKIVGLSLISLGAQMTHAAASDPPLPNFDALVPFSQPRFATVFRSNDATQHLYFVLPNFIDFGHDVNGKIQLGLVHYGFSKRSKFGKGAVLTVTFQPSNDSRFSEVTDEVRKGDPQAVFSFAAPVESDMKVLINDRFLDSSAPQNLTSSGSIHDPHSITLRLSEIGARAFLNSWAKGSDLFGVEYTYVLRGVQGGSNEIVQRSFTYSTTFPGMCSAHPELFVDSRKSRTGCLDKKH
jgi:hypothetical protein